MISDLKCPACGKYKLFVKWTYVQRPWDGFNDQFKLCRKCRKLGLRDLQMKLFPSEFPVQKKD